MGLWVQVPLIILLLAVLGLRTRISPSARVFVRAAPEHVFELLDPRTSKMQAWMRGRVISSLIDEGRRIYRLTWHWTARTGEAKTASVDFRLAEIEEGRHIRIERADIDGRDQRNELLGIEAWFTPAPGGTNFKLRFDWGPRQLLAQLLARTDLWGAIYRIKSVVEHGVPSARADTLISLGISVGTGLITIICTALIFGWVFAVVLVAAVLAHEFGHLLAFRLIGQSWGRLVFLPFLGAIAVPRENFKTQGESMFAVLMGPGLSVAISMAAALYVWLGGTYATWAMPIGVVVAALNLFNLLPVEPLDGGVALRSVLARLMGRGARFGLIATGLPIIAGGYFMGLPLLMMFGALPIVANFRARSIDRGLEPLSLPQVALSGLCYLAIVAGHAGPLAYLISAL